MPVDYAAETVEERERRYAKILALINLLRPRRLPRTRGVQMMLPTNLPPKRR